MQSTVHERLIEWKALLEEREQNNVPIAEFCRQKNISPSRYYYYQELIKKPEKTKIKKQVKKNENQPSSKVAQIKIVNPSPSKEHEVIRLILPNSIQCILPKDLSIQEMKIIVEALLSC